MEQKTNEEALATIAGLADYCASAVEHLQGDVEEHDPPALEGDDYEPQMHNDLPGGGARFPNLDRRWLAIGITDLQRGLMALRRAAGENGGQF